MQRYNLIFNSQELFQVFLIFSLPSFKELKAGANVKDFNSIFQILLHFFSLFFLLLLHSADY